MADKIKTLSQAIRLGATFRPQCTGGFFEDGKSCALGAAIEALTGVNTEPDISVQGFLLDRFPAVQEVLFEIPIMNDRHGWSRESIADWLEAQGL